MRRLAKVSRLTPRQLAMLVEAASTLAFCCVALRFAPYRRLMRYLPIPPDQRAPIELEREIAVALRRAGNLFSDGLCLREAMAGYFMFARRGHIASIRLGMKQDERGVAVAHAWLVSGPHIITGGTSAELRQFAELVTVGSRRS